MLDILCNNHRCKNSAENTTLVSQQHIKLVLNHIHLDLLSKSKFSLTFKNQFLNSSQQKPCPMAPLGYRPHSGNAPRTCPFPGAPRLYRYSWPSVSADVELLGTEGRLCCAILYTELEHPQILVSVWEGGRLGGAVLEPIPHGYQWTSVYRNS